MRRTRKIARIQRRRPVVGHRDVKLHVSSLEGDRFDDAARVDGYESTERWAKEVLSLRAWEILSNRKKDR